MVPLSSFFLFLFLVYSNGEYTRALLLLFFFSSLVRLTNVIAIPICRRYVDRARAPDAEHERLSPCIVGRLSGSILFETGGQGPIIREMAGLPLKGKFCLLLWRNVSFFSFFFFPRDRIPRLRRHSGGRKDRGGGERREERFYKVAKEMQERISTSVSSRKTQKLKDPRAHLLLLFDTFPYIFFTTVRARNASSNFGRLFFFFF